MMKNKIFNKKWSKSQRSELRSNSTVTEVLFWMKIRNKKLNGLKFRRQHGIGKYIVDFYCPKIKLVIELDGAYHNTNIVISKDIVRDNFLKGLGITVFRYPNYKAIEKFEEIKKDILIHAANYKPNGT